MPKFGLTLNDPTMDATHALPTSSYGYSAVNPRHLIAEVVVVESATAIVAAIRQAANVMPQATQLYEGVAIQRVFQALYASIFPERG